MSAVIDARMLRGGANSNRAFNYAVLASIVLHGALLFSFSMRQTQSPPAVPGPIVARLAPPSVQAPAAAAPQAEPPKPRVEEPKPPPQVKPVPQQKPSPLAKAEPAPVKPSAKAAPEVPPQPAPTPPAHAAPSTAPPAPASVPGPVAKADPTPTSPSQSADLDAGSLARFRLDVIGASRKFKRYPRVAMDNNWEGRSDVRVTFGVDGRRTSIVIVKSSGHEILDKQALDTVQKAFVPVPPGLRGKEFSFDIPVIFGLKDQDSG